MDRLAAAAAPVERHLRGVLEDLLFRDEIHRAMVAAVRDRGEDGSLYFERNRYLYQSPLRFRIQVVTVGLGDDPQAVARREQSVFPMFARSCLRTLASDSTRTACAR